jgi:hypothetical protein
LLFQNVGTPVSGNCAVVDMPDGIPYLVDKQWRKHSVTHKSALSKLSALSGIEAINQES